LQIHSTGTVYLHSEARGFIGTRITNYGDDAVSLFRGAGSNALRRGICFGLELTLTKFNLISKENNALMRHYNGAED
jgi:hypothetical protein